LPTQDSPTELVYPDQEIALSLLSGSAGHVLNRDFPDPFYRRVSARLYQLYHGDLKLQIILAIRMAFSLT